MYFISNELEFPHPSLANEDGLLAIGGDLSIARLKLAYESGIFPWFNEDEPIQWYSPNPRFVLFPERLKISQSMKQVMKKNEFQFTFNSNFREVILHCKINKRNENLGTWITDEMEHAYNNLHQAGLALSGECWFENELVGGLYGVLVKNIFCGESMFSLKSNASKFTFIQMVEHLKLQRVKLIDCQVYTKHLESLGAEMIDRNLFLTYLK